MRPPPLRRIGQAAAEIKPPLLAWLAAAVRHQREFVKAAMIERPRPATERDRLRPYRRLDRPADIAWLRPLLRGQEIDTAFAAEEDADRGRLDGPVPRAPDLARDLHELALRVVERVAEIEPRTIGGEDPERG